MYLSQRIKCLFIFYLPIWTYVTWIMNAIICFIYVLIIKKLSIKIAYGFGIFISLFQMINYFIYRNKGDKKFEDNEEFEYLKDNNIHNFLPEKNEE